MGRVGRQSSPRSRQRHHHRLPVTVYRDGGHWADAANPRRCELSAGSLKIADPLPRTDPSRCVQEFGSEPGARPTKSPCDPGNV